MRMDRLLAAALVAASFMLPAAPMAATGGQPAPWPESARGRPLPRPSWVLVVPARRNADGSLVIWDRDDPWTRAWRVPRLVSGIRMVTLLGDSEDRRAVTAEAIDGMLVDSLSPVMRKYGAPALALAVSDGDGVALAGYVPGSAASWQPSGVGADADETRARSLAVLAAMFAGRGEARQQAPYAGAAVGDEARISGVRDGEGGTEEYRVVLSAATAELPVVRGRVGGLSAARLVSLDPDGAGYVAVFETAEGYDSLAQALRGAGFSVR